MIIKAYTVLASNDIARWSFRETIIFSLVSVIIPRTMEQILKHSDTKSARNGIFQTLLGRIAATN